MDIGYHERRGETFAGGVSNYERHTIIRERREIAAIAAEGSNLTATPAVVQRSADSSPTLHEPLLDSARKHPVLANVN